MEFSLRRSSRTLVVASRAAATAAAATAAAAAAATAAAAAAATAVAAGNGSTNYQALTLSDSKPPEFRQYAHITSRVGVRYQASIPAVLTARQRSKYKGCCLWERSCLLCDAYLSESSISECVRPC